MARRGPGAGPYDYGWSSRVDWRAIERERLPQWALFPETFRNESVFPAAVLAGPLVATTFRNVNDFPTGTEVLRGPAPQQYLGPTVFVDPDVFYTAQVVRGAAPSLQVRPEAFFPFNDFFETTITQGIPGKAVHGSFYQNINSFWPTTVTRGAAPTGLITPQLYVDPDSYGDSTVVRGPGPTNAITPSVFPDADTFFATTVTRGAAPVTQQLAPSTFVDGDAFFTSVVAPAGATEAGYTALADNDDQVLTDHDDMELSVEEAGFTPPTNANVSPALFVSPAAFFTTTVSTSGGGTSAISPTIYVDPDAFFPTQVGQSAVTVGLTPTVFVDPDTFFAATVAPAGAPGFTQMTDNDNEPLQDWDNEILLVQEA